MIFIILLVLVKVLIACMFRSLCLKILVFFLGYMESWIWNIYYFLIFEWSLYDQAGEMLHVAEAFIDKKYHPTVICRGNKDFYVILSTWVDYPSFT